MTRDEDNLDGKSLTRAAVMLLCSKSRGQRTVLYEAGVNGSVADAVILMRERKSERIIAIEAKSRKDKISHARQQCRNYRKWADEVYLAVEGEHGRQRIRGGVKREVSLGRLGLVVVSRTSPLVIRQRTGSRPDFGWMALSSHKDLIFDLCKSAGIDVKSSWTKPKLLTALRQSGGLRSVGREAFIRTLLRNP